MKKMCTILKIKGKMVRCAIVGFILALVAVTPMAAYSTNQPFGITVKQVFSDSSNSTAATYTYVLRALGPDDPMPAGSTAEGYRFAISGESSKHVGPIIFVRPGVFEYELYEVIEAGKPGYKFDNRKYTLEVYVDASLNATLVITNEDGTKASSIVFEGEYNTLPSDQNLMTDPPVKKTVSGKPSAKSTFTFKLAARNASYPMPKGSERGVKTIRVVGSGTGEFGTWSYEKTGTYYYTVYEEDTREKGYAYDKAVYTITDTVSDNNGQLVLSRVVTNSSNKKVNAMEFVNKYSQSNSDNAKREGGGGSGGSGGTTAKTGDDMKVGLYVTLLAFSGAFVIGFVAFLKKRKRGKTAA